MFEVVLGGGGEPQLVADKILKDRPGIAGNRTVCFVRDHELKVSWREEALIFVVKGEALDCRDNDFGFAPVVFIFLIHYTSVVVVEPFLEILSRLVLKLEP